MTDATLIGLETNAHCCVTIIESEVLLTGTFDFIKNEGDFGDTLSPNFNTPPVVSGMLEKTLLSKQPSVSISSSSSYLT